MTLHPEGPYSSPRSFMSCASLCRLRRRSRRVSRRNCGEVGSGADRADAAVTVRDNLPVWRRGRVYAPSTPCAVTGERQTECAYYLGEAAFRRVMPGLFAVRGHKRLIPPDRRFVPK